MGDSNKNGRGLIVGLICAIAALGVLAVVMVVLLIHRNSATSGGDSTAAGGRTKDKREEAKVLYTVGDEIALQDVTGYEYLYAATGGMADHAGRAWSVRIEEGIPVFRYREGSGQEISRQITFETERALSAEEWEAFLSCIDGGTVTDREAASSSYEKTPPGVMDGGGGSRSISCLSWNGQEAEDENRRFKFASDKKSREMTELVERLCEDAADMTEASGEAGLDGFSGLAPESFAARAVGVYKPAGAGAQSDYYEERLEVYSVGGNLYALQSGEGFRAIELFAEEWDGFALTDTDEIPVSVLSFSVQSNLSQYQSPTPAGYTMRLTENGLSFTDYDGFGVDAFVGVREYERVDELPGTNGDAGFDYRSALAMDYFDSLGSTRIPTPKEWIGTWVTLGDSVDAVYLELTPEGLAQVYRKLPHTEVSLRRGVYAFLEDEDGNLVLRMMLRTLGMGGMTEECELICSPVSEDFAEIEETTGNLFSGYRALVSVKPEEIPMQTDFDDTYGYVTPPVIGGYAETDEISSYLNGSWTLYGRGNPTRLTPLLVMNFMPMYNSVTVYRPDDGASCSGTYEIDRLEFEESDGAWICRMKLSFLGIPEDFSGPLYGHHDEAEGYFNLYLGRTEHEDHLLLAETGNGGTTGVTDMIFGEDYGVGGSPRFVFGRYRGDLEVDVETYEERREGVMRRNETFYGFVWMDTNDTAQIQPVNPVTFSYDFYGEQRTVLCPVPMESLHTTRYDVVNHGEAGQGSYNCGLYRVVTDAEGTVVSMEELTQYDGEMRGLYKKE